jgi:hypothetical protein
VNPCIDNLQRGNWKGHSRDTLVFDTGLRSVDRSGSSRGLQ